MKWKWLILLIPLLIAADKPVFDVLGLSPKTVVIPKKVDPKAECEKVPVEPKVEPRVEPVPEPPKLEFEKVTKAPANRDRQLIYFSSPACVPCKKMPAILKKFAEEHGLTYGEWGDGKFQDIEHLDIIKHKGKFKTEITVLPTVIVASNKMEFGRTEGVNIETIDGLLNELWSLPAPVAATKAQVHVAPHYTWPGSGRPVQINQHTISALKKHISGPPHNVDTSNMSADDMIQYHNWWHDTYGERDEGSVVKAAAGALFRSGQNCPNGRCPVGRRRR